MGMKFKVEKTNMPNNIFIAMALGVLGLLFALQFTNSVHIKSFFFSVIIIILMVGNYYILLVNTLYYRIDEEYLVIGSILKFNDVEIRLRDIEFYSERITLINQSGIPGLFSKRFSVGKGYIEGLGKVNMFITSSKKAVYFGTDQGYYAISPENPHEMITLLKKENIMEKNIFRDVQESDVLRSVETVRQYLLFDAVLIMMVISFPVILFYLGYLPNYISVTLVSESLLSYIPSKIFVNNTIFYGAMNILLLLVFTVLAKTYSRIDRIYYYRLMIVPLLATFFLMLYVINTILPIFI